MSIDSLVAEFDKLIGDKPYFSPAQLISIGVFGSSSAVSAALKRGAIPFIKVSPKRTIVPRSAVLEYFKKNLEGAKETKD